MPSGFEVYFTQTGGGPCFLAGAWYLLDMYQSTCLTDAWHLVAGIESIVNQLNSFCQALPSNGQANIKQLANSWTLSNKYQAPAKKQKANRNCLSETVI